MPPVAEEELPGTLLFDGVEAHPSFEEDADLHGRPIPEECMVRNVLLDRDNDDVLPIPSRSAPGDLVVAVRSHTTSLVKMCCVLSIHQCVS